MNVRNEGQAQVFKNPVLELLTKTNAYITFAYVTCIIASLLYVNFSYYKHSVPLTVGLYVTGFFFWTLLEYLLHRYVFHWTNETEFGKKFHYYVHGIHHQYPKDEQRLFMPPVPGLIVALLFLSITYLVMQEYAFAFLPGLINGYMGYVFIHYMTHAFKPIKGIKVLWTHHALHHYKYPDKCFGVSSPLWDIIFRTMPPKEF